MHLDTTSIRHVAGGLRPQLVITHRGVPVGRTRLTGGELAVGELRPEPGYAAIRDLIAYASRSFWAALVVDHASPASPARLDVLGRAAELELELRDLNGALVWTDFVNIIERPFGAGLPQVMVRFRFANAARAAVLVSRGGVPGGCSAA